MGRATIISGGTDGRYLIEMDYGVAQRDALIAKIDLDLYQLGLRKTWQEDQLEEVELGLVSLQAEQAAFINAYVVASKLIPPNKALTDSIKVQLDAKTAEVTRQQLIVQNARNALHMTTAQIKSAELDKAKLNLAEVTEQRQAWCADLTENATGAVATLEVPGESALILVKPSAPEATITDGRLIAREVQTPAQVFWNAAVLPGWQKFLPTYRWGTITALDQAADKCTVELAEAKSSANQLNVNQAATLQNVPVVYMTCNAAAFEVGDRVVVEFQANDWAQPRVIGFVDYPKACAGGALYCIPADDSALYGWSPPLVGGGGTPNNGGKGVVAFKGDPLGATEAELDGNNRTAGVLSPLARSGNGYSDSVVRGVRPDASDMPAHGPTEIGNSSDPAYYSSMGRALLEWVSVGAKYMVTYFDTIRVNGVDKGHPTPNKSPLRAFVGSPPYHTEPTLFAVCLRSGGGVVEVFSRPLEGGNLVPWDLKFSVDFSAIPAPLGVDLNELQRLLVHPKVQTFTCWFNRKGHYTVDLVDFTASFIPATVSFSGPAGTSSSGTYVYTFSYPFMVDYVGDTLQYATITGTKTHWVEMLDGPLQTVGPYVDWPLWGSTEYTDTEVVVADFWGVEVEISSLSVHAYGIIYYNHTPSTGETKEPYDFTKTCSLTSRQVYYFGGPGDPIFFDTKDYPSTVVDVDHWDDSWLAGRCGPTDSACHDWAGNRRTMRIPAMETKRYIRHLGVDTLLSEASTPEYVAEFYPQPSDYTLPPLAGGSQNTWLATYRTGEWDRILVFSPSGPITTLDQTLLAFRTLFAPATMESFQYASTGYNTSTGMGETSMNLRHYSGIAIASVPRLLYGSEVFPTTADFDYPGHTARFYRPPTLNNLTHDYTLWHTYCSNPIFLQRYALPLSVTPAPGRLKHLQFGGC